MTRDIQMDETIVFKVPGEGSTVWQARQHAIRLAKQECPEHYEIVHIVHEEVTPAHDLRSDDALLDISDWRTEATVVAVPKGAARPPRPAPRP